jgi:hypothetical protein
VAKIKCRLIVHSASSLHLQQIYTGFLLLHQNGIIEMEQVLTKEKMVVDHTKPQHLRDARKTHLRVIVNGTLKLHYDTHDSWEIDEEFLDEADFYFKRSYCPALLTHLGTSQLTKIIPLGLNYPLYPDTLDIFGLKRSLTLSSGIEKLVEVYRSLNLTSIFLFTPRLRLIQSLPNYEVQPKVLFMVQAWNPNEHPDSSPEKIEQRERINSTRAVCIKLLKEEFKNDFFGGFSHTKFAIENYRDHLIPNSNLSSKRNYISFQKKYPITVATTGLHGSIGWKFAEYVAFSKAIVSENLNYEVPGKLEHGKNYLAFNSPEDCVNQVRLLFSDHHLRKSIMANNALYYLSFLRPEVLVVNTIITALSKAYS